jgi:hypothetical protein
MIGRLEEVWGGWSEGVRHRILGALFAFPSWGVLGIARALQPSPNGFGTHRQLGLASCSMLAFTGWPCPMCGMTTTFAWMARGSVSEALRTQPFGIVLFLCTALVALLGAFDLLTGRGALGRLGSLLQRVETKVATGLLGGMLLGWAYKAMILHPEIWTNAGSAPSP